MALLSPPRQSLGWFIASRSGRSPRQRAGFTLIETALALGIVAFALIPVVGLLPIGLQVSRNASDLTFTSQIAQRLGGMIQQDDPTDFDALTGGTSTLEASYFYFDSEGQPVSSVAGADTVPASAVYSACIQQETPAATTPSMADATTGTFILEIVNDPAHLLTGKPPQPPQLPTTLPATLRSKAVFVPVFLVRNGG